MSQLFRQEVINKQASKHLGNVSLSTPLSFWVITILIATIISGIIIFITFGEYARKERVQGLISPSEGLVKISPSQGGNYGQVFVELGDIIEVDTPLVQLKEDVIMSGGRRLSESLLEELQSQKQSLLDELKHIPKEIEQKRQILDQKKQDKLSEANRYLDQLSTQKRSVSLDKGIYINLQKLLASGAASALEASSAETEYLSALRNLQSIENEHANVLSDVKDIESQIILLETEQEHSESTIKNQLSEVEQRRFQIEAASETVMRAPVAGTIATINVRKGQQALIGKSIITILPKGGRLQADLLVPTRAIGFVKKGQPVRLLYDAFPYQKFGSFDGVVVKISKAVIQKNDLVNPSNNAESVFLVTIDIDNQFIVAAGEQIPLQAGMTLSADIILEDRKIWEWIFEPLLGAFR